MELILEEKDKIEDTDNIIKVVGVGGAGNNAVNQMYENRIEGIDYVICNTDIQDLEYSPVRNKIQLGIILTEGLGAGSIPESGKAAAKESMSEIKQMLGGNTRMVILAAGMGGGTGTGATPVIAQVAKEMGLVVVAIVTTPFGFERKRIKEAVKGIEALEPHVDSLIVINNQKLQHIYGDLSFPEACAKANDVLVMAAKSISEIQTQTSLQNIDYSDLERALKGSGMAVFGVGRAKGGTDRIEKAVKQALYSPLLENCDIVGAENLLVNVVVKDEDSYSLEEREQLGLMMGSLSADFFGTKFGFRVDNSLEDDELIVTIVATNFTAKESEIPEQETNEEEPTIPEFKQPQIEMIVEDTRQKEQEERAKRIKKEEAEKKKRILQEKKDPIGDMIKDRIGKKKKESPKKSSAFQGMLDFLTAKDVDDTEMD